MTHPPSRRRQALGGPLLLVAACTSGPVWTPAEREGLAALQQAVHAALRLEVATPATMQLADGQDVGDLDLLLQPFPSPVASEGEFLSSWTVGSHPLLRCMLYRRNDSTELTCAGHTLTGFDAVHAFAVDATRGAVLLATRRGEQTVTTAQSHWSGSLWRRRFRPELSTDGSCFTFVASDWFSDRAMLAPTASPERAAPIELPGVVQWPVWPGRDGSRLRSIVVVDGRVEVRDGDRVVATADTFANATFDARSDRLRVHLSTAGKTRLLFGDRLSPPLDSFHWIEESADGAHWLAAGRIGEETCVVYDDRIVQRTARLAWMALSDDGSTWACAVQEGEQHFVVRPEGRSGPFPEVTQLVLAPDGSALAVCTRQGRQSSWTLDGRPLGAQYTHIEDVVLLPQRGGAVYTASDGKARWLVTPAGADGPWDAIARWRHVDVARHHVIALVQKGREVQRRVLPLP